MTRTNLEHVGTEEIITLLHSTKTGIFRAIDKGAAGAVGFHLGVMTLEIFERELRRRGLDPSDEKKFGRDIIGEMVQEKLKEAENERLQQSKA